MNYSVAASKFIIIITLDLASITRHALKGLT